MPLPSITDEFTGSNGSNLDNTSTDTGAKIWNALAGTWKIQGNQAISNAKPDSALVIPAGSSNGSVEATIYRNGSTSFDAYVLINANSNANDTLTFSWTSALNGSLELWKKTGGSWVKLQSVTGLYPGGMGTAPASAVVRLESPSTGVLKMYLDGVLKMTYTLTAGETTTFKNGTHTYSGIGSDNNATVTFDAYRYYP